MKILLSAFACTPNVGSEAGVGWRWAIELAKEHEVLVVTDATRRPAIEEEILRNPVPGLDFVFYRPWLLRWVPLNSWTAQLLYTAWQFWLFFVALGLHRRRKFDVAMHVTYGVFRHPSFLGYLGIPFVFGPLGGGEDAPFALKRSIKGTEKVKEIVRTFINKVALFDPFLWVAFAGSKVILTKTGDSARALPWPFRSRAHVYPEIGIDVRDGVVPVGRVAGEPFRALFAGRLLGLKGVHLAIRALAAAQRQGLDVRLSIVGRGPYEQVLREEADAMGVNDRIEWLGHIPQAELFELYRRMHCLLFPSLHDSSGNVVLEAQANALPIICLDLGGPATLVSEGSAIVVDSKGSEQDVVERLATGLKRLADDEPARLAMAECGLAHARTFAWNERALGALALAGL